MGIVLAEEATVKVNGKWFTLKALLVNAMGGKKVAYIDKDGDEVFSQPFCRSQYKNMRFDEVK